MATEVQWAYLAGIIDGEGSMAVYQNGPRLSIANTYLPMLEWVKATFQTGRIWANQKAKDQFPNAKQCYQWDCGARAIRVILPNIIPYLLIKKERAALLLEYISGVNPDTNLVPSDAELERRKDLVERINARKAKGH